MKVLVFGLGAHGGGFAAANYFLDRGDEVRVTDLRGSDVLGETMEILTNRGATCIAGEHRMEDFFWADIVIKNPAIAPDNKYLQAARIVITDFSWLFASPWCSEVQIIAITGTKGKTTTAAAVAHVLNSMGHETVQCGNMGISAFTVLADWEKRKAEGRRLPAYLVCEFSSWQIRDMYAAFQGELPAIQIAALTSLYADHQNAYKDLESYRNDKLELFGAHCENVLVPDSMIRMVREYTHLPPKRIHGIDRLSGRVLAQNSPHRCAYAICRTLGVKWRDILKALKTFKGVPHRIEQVGVADSIMFINDSAATIPEAVLFSFENCRPLPIHLICGGTDKNLKAEGMRIALKEASSLHLLDGSFTRNKLIPLLKQEGLPYAGPFDNMDAAVDSAYETALKKKDPNSDAAQVVMLSPGAASFELFQHEFDRGDKFKIRSNQKIAETGSSDGGASDSASSPRT
jgi:UDP-N-acetylmuramoylalanine--D-glutamate ligase